MAQQELQTFDSVGIWEVCWNYLGSPTDFRVLYHIVTEPEIEIWLMLWGVVYFNTNFYVCLKVFNLELF